MDALTGCWITAALVVALAGLGGCIWVLRESRRQPHPFDGDGFAAFFMLGIGALVALAVGLRRVGGLWSTAGIVAVNVVVQPFCLYLFAAGVYQLAMAFVGWAVYAWRPIPRQEFEVARYRSLRWYCASQGIVGCLFAWWLAYLCLGPLL